MFVTAVTVSGTTVSVLGALLLVVGGLVLARCVVMLGLAHRHARAARRLSRGGPGPPVVGPVSVVVPAYNEVVCVPKTLRSLVASDHLGGGRRRGRRLRRRHRGCRRGAGAAGGDRGADPNRGKAAALNTGVLRASHEIVVMLDADTVFEPSTVRRLVEPFADPAVGATA